VNSVISSCGFDTENSLLDSVLVLSVEFLGCMAVHQNVLETVNYIYFSPFFLLFNFP
jgi:hypothetical protein